MARMFILAVVLLSVVSSCAAVGKWTTLDTETLVEFIRNTLLQYCVACVWTALLGGHR